MPPGPVESPCGRHQAQNEQVEGAFSFGNSSFVDHQHPRLSGALVLQGDNESLVVSRCWLLGLYFFQGEYVMRRLLIVALLALASGAQAESTATKKELVAKVLQLQQPAIEMAAQALAERPAAQMMQQAGMALQSKVAADKREAVAKEIQADVKKYVDEAVPLVRERAVKLAPSTIGALLEEKFSEDELKQLVAIIESPVNRKFLQMGGEMQKVLVDKLVAETQGAIEPKIKALEQAISKRLGLPASIAPASRAAKPPAKAASK